MKFTKNGELTHKVEITQNVEVRIGNALTVGNLLRIGNSLRIGTFIRDYELGPQNRELRFCNSELRTHSECGSHSNWELIQNLELTQIWGLGIEDIDI